MKSRPHPGPFVTLGVFFLAVAGLIMITQGDLPAQDNRGKRAPRIVNSGQKTPAGPSAADRFVGKFATTDMRLRLKREGGRMVGTLNAVGSAFKVEGVVKKGMLEGRFGDKTGSWPLSITGGSDEVTLVANTFSATMQRKKMPEFSSGIYTSNSFWLRLDDDGNGIKGTLRQNGREYTIAGSMVADEFEGTYREGSRAVPFRIIYENQGFVFQTGTLSETLTLKPRMCDLKVIVTPEADFTLKVRGTRIEGVNNVFVVPAESVYVELYAKGYLPISKSISFPAYETYTWKVNLQVDEAERARIKEQADNKDHKAYRYAANRDTIPALENYLNNYPRGLHVDDATRRLLSLYEGYYNAAKRRMDALKDFADALNNHRHADSFNFGASWDRFDYTEFDIEYKAGVIEPFDLALSFQGNVLWGKKVGIFRRNVCSYSRQYDHDRYSAVVRKFVPENLSGPGVCSDLDDKIRCNVLKFGYKNMERRESFEREDMTCVWDGHYRDDSLYCAAAPPIQKGGRILLSMELAPVAKRLIEAFKDRYSSEDLDQMFEYYKKYIKLR